MRDEAIFKKRLDILCIFYEEKIAAKNELYTLILNLKNNNHPVSIKEFRSLRREALSEWIRNRCQKYGAQITDDAIQSLADRIGSNLWVLNSEIDKLAIYVGHGKTISENALISHAWPAK